MLAWILAAMLGWPGAASAQAAPRAERTDQDASERLQEAIAAFYRGDLGAAADGFHDVIDYPVQVRTRQELHEGFLHYAYTLFLQNSKIQAAEKLGIALRLDPGHQPSPVVLRPDLFEFYQEQRASFLRAAEGKAPEPETPAQIFAELQVRAGVVEGQTLPFVPIFGIGLYKLGHRNEAAAVGVIEAAALVVNASGLVLRAVAFNKRTPSGDLVYDLSVAMNVPAGFVFWAVFVVEVVRTLTLQKQYTDNPEMRPRMAGPSGRTPPPPVLGLGPGGITLAFW